MPTFVLERVVPPALDLSSQDHLALHSRWAADAYREAGIVWLGGVATEDRMYSLVVADERADVERYLAHLGVGSGEFALKQVVGFLGPQVAMSRDDPRYRPRMPPSR